MGNRDVIKIVVAESAVVIRMGIMNALMRSADSNFVFKEIATVDDFRTKMQSYSPDVLIVNPLFGGGFDVEACRRSEDLRMKNVKIVALVTSLLPQGLTDCYDAVMTIFDGEDDLHKSIDAALGLAEEHLVEEEQLSEREKQVLRGVVRGLTNKEIANEMNLSIYTILTHRRNIARKLKIHSSIALAIYAISNKIVSVDEVK